MTGKAVYLAVATALSWAVVFVCGSQFLLDFFVMGAVLHVCLGRLLRKYTLASIWDWPHFRSNKDLFPSAMEAVAASTTKNYFFQGRSLRLCDDGSGKVGPGTQLNLKFDDTLSAVHYEAIGHPLLKINLKTVETALEGSHADRVTANFLEKAEALCLVIAVSYDFLPPIEEVISFQKRPFDKDEMQTIAFKQLFDETERMKARLMELAPTHAFSAELNPLSEKTEVPVKVTAPKVVITWNLYLSRCPNIVIPLSVFYVDSKKQTRVNSQLVPERGVAVGQNGFSASMTLRFFIEKHLADLVLLQLSGRYEGHYVVAVEPVEVAA